MSAQHTPGPWIDQPGTTSGRVVIAPEQGKVKRNVASCGGPNRDANARLIAAAPDLLAALIAMRERWELYSGGIGHAGQTDDRLMRQADAAIAKARGEA